MNRGNNGFEGDAGDLCRRYPPRLPARKASSSALPKAPALPQNSKGPLRRRRGRFARPQGEGWLPPAEAENAANVALRMLGGAVSPCSPMLEVWRPRGKTHQCAYIVELQAPKAVKPAALPLCAQISSFFLLIVFLRFLLVSRLLASFVHLFLLKPFFPFFLAIIEQAAAEHGV